MIICFYIEVQDKAHQVEVEHHMKAPFIDAGKVSDMTLEEFEEQRQKQYNAQANATRKDH